MSYLSLHFKILFVEKSHSCDRDVKIEIKNKVIWSLWHPVRRSREKPLLSALVQEYRLETSFMYSTDFHTFLIHGSTLVIDTGNSLCPF